jgi:hypothetical protein
MHEYDALQMNKIIKKTTNEIPFGGSAGMAFIGFGGPFGLAERLTSAR